MKWTLFISLLFAGTLAHAVDTVEELDLSSLSESPLVVLEALTPDRAGHGRRMPQSCTDAKVTPEQHELIEEAAYQAERESVKIKADLKLAVMDYVHTISDDQSDLAAAQTSGNLINEGLNKLATNKISLVNNIVYTILNPDQRTKAVECLMIMGKAEFNKKLRKACKNLPRKSRHKDGRHEKPNKPEKPEQPPVEQPTEPPAQPPAQP